MKSWARVLYGCAPSFFSRCLLPIFLVSLVGVAQYLRVDSKVGLHRGQDLQVIVLVHEQDEYLVRVLVVIVNFEPVDLGFGESDLALRCVLVGALVDLGIGDRHQVALGGAYLDCPVVIAECEHRFNVLSFRGGHTDAVERRLVGKAD